MSAAPKQLRNAEAFQGPSTLSAREVSNTRPVRSTKPNGAFSSLRNVVCERKRGRVHANGPRCLLVPKRLKNAHFSLCQ